MPSAIRVNTFMFRIAFGCAGMFNSGWLSWRISHPLGHADRSISVHNITHLVTLCIHRLHQWIIWTERFTTYDKHCLLCPPTSSYLLQSHARTSDWWALIWETRWLGLARSHRQSIWSPKPIRLKKQKSRQTWFLRTWNRCHRARKWRWPTSSIHNLRVSTQNA